MCSKFTTDTNLAIPVTTSWLKITNSPMMNRSKSLCASMICAQFFGLLTWLLMTLSNSLLGENVEPEILVWQRRLPCMCHEIWPRLHYRRHVGEVVLCCCRDCLNLCSSSVVVSHSFSKRRNRRVVFRCNGVHAQTGLLRPEFCLMM